MRYFITLSYKGTTYHGWQIQPDAISVQEVLNKTLSTVCRAEIEVVGAGRTDAGVHASQMVAHFDVEVPFSNAANMVHKFNSLLPDTIVIQNIQAVKEDAHARFDAVSRSYVYKIFLGRNPFELDTNWQLHSTKLDVDQMNRACSILRNYINFKSFSRSKTDVKTYDCSIFDAFWILKDQNLEFHISANRFLRNMVRAIVGTMIDVGTGKTSLTEFEEIIVSENRSKAGKSAPSTGLYLSKVDYPEDIYLWKQEKHLI